MPTDGADGNARQDVCVCGVCAAALQASSRDNRKLADKERKAMEKAHQVGVLHRQEVGKRWLGTSRREGERGWRPRAWRVTVPRLQAAPMPAGTSLAWHLRPNPKAPAPNPKVTARRACRPSWRP